MDLSIVFGLGAALCWGSSDFVAKLATEKIGYLKTAMFIQYVGGLFLLLVSYKEIVLLWQYPVATYLALGLGVVNVVGTSALFKSFEVGQLSIVSPIVSSYPALSTTLALFLLDESLSQIRFIGIIAILAGIILVSLHRNENSPAARRNIAAGVGYALVSFTAMGFLYFALKVVVVHLGGLLPALLIRWVSALILTVAVVVAGSRSITHSSRNILLVAFIGIVDSLANISYNLGLVTGAVAVVSTISGLFSAVTVLLALLLLKERLMKHQVLGFLAILIGIGVIGYLA